MTNRVMTIYELISIGDQQMNRLRRVLTRFLHIALGVAAISLIAHSGSALADEVAVTLSGSQEIPPVTTAATGTAKLTVGADKSMSGRVTISGMNATVAHIHEAPGGATGPIMIPLTKISDNVWAVPDGVTLTDAQYEAYRAGRLYFNIHSEAYRSGEIRGQIKP